MARSSAERERHELRVERVAEVCRPVRRRQLGEHHQGAGSSWARRWRASTARFAPFLGATFQPRFLPLIFFRPLLPRRTLCAICQFLEPDDLFRRQSVRV